MANLLVLLLYCVPVTSGPPRPDPGDSLAVLHDPQRAPRSWFAVDGRGLWICWHEPDARTGLDPSCWLRVLAGPGDGSSRAPLLPSAGAVRGAFLDSATFVLSGGDSQRWIVRRGDDRARRLDTLKTAPAGAEGLVLTTPHPPLCRASGPIPVRGQLSDRTAVIWVVRPCAPVAQDTCLHGQHERNRRIAGAKARLSVDLSLRSRRADAPGVLTSGRDEQVVFALRATVGFDPAARRRAEWTRSAWQRHTAPRVRTLPPPISRARALARRERTALRRVLCTPQPASAPR